jgi:Zn-finger nucleic acid-binding protein
MKCPKCSDEIRPIDSAEGVELDFCGSCKGIWFDAGEVAEYFELATDVPDLDTANATKGITNYHCPKCDAILEEFRYSKLDDLLVDRCPGCGGIWLDQGEVPRLEQLSAKLEDPRSRILRTMKGLEAKGYRILGMQ